MPFNRKDHHTVVGQIRPRFKLHTSYSKEEVFEQLAFKVANDPTVVGKKVYEQYYLDIPKNEQHYWSPELRISCDRPFDEDHLEPDEEEEGTTIRVIVGPKFSVWVLFVFIYTLMGVICLFGGMYGIVQWTLDKPSGWIWCIPISLVIIAAVFVTAKMGQSKGRDQTLHLVSSLYHALEKGNVERVES